MGTIVTIEADAPSDVCDRALVWFHEVETRCSRFDPESELMQLRPGQPAKASTILFQCVAFALRVAEETGGAFDPTVGHRMEALGYNREHRSGKATTPVAAEPDVTFRDVELNHVDHSILLRRPLRLDLGAVAKGLAIDAAARELAACENFAIDAGGDLYMGGQNAQGEPWSVGIRDPFHPDQVLERLRVSDQAVCTSGFYERGEHILDPRGTSSRAVASATVVAPGAMLADALATAAFVLGPVDGIELLTRMGVEGLILTRDMQRFQTPGLPHA